MNIRATAVRPFTEGPVGELLGVSTQRTDPSSRFPGDRAIERTRDGVSRDRASQLTVRRLVAGNGTWSPKHERPRPGRSGRGTSQQTHASGNSGAA
jgi:hypothetical protein